MSDWRIRRREERCERCARAFLEGESIFSLLFVEDARLRFVRHGVCSSTMTRSTRI